MRDGIGAGSLRAMLKSLCVAAFFIGFSVVAYAEQDMSSTLETNLGPVAALQQSGVVSALGIPYAVPPVGEARWLPPRPAARWSGTLDATAHPNRCFGAPYMEVLAGREIPGDFSEDCLYINIYTPAADNKKRPVMFWIHGGALIQGSANEYDGRALARDNDVVVVTVNYRLSAFGFLDLSSFGRDYAGSASLGLQDQIAALAWVRDNIADYGGDAGNVTIFGESAGGASVLALLAAPSAKGLFHKAIGSSPGESVGPPQNSIPGLSQRLGAEGPELLKKLRDLPAEDVLALQVEGAALVGSSVDGTIVTKQPTLAILENGAGGVPLIVGSNKDEGTLLVDSIPPEGRPFIIPAFAAIIGNGDPTGYLALLDEKVPSGDMKEKVIRLWYDYFRASALRSGEASSVAGAGGWVYSFEVPGSTDLGVTHGSDLAFTFNMLNNPGDMDFPVFHGATDFNKDMANKWSKTLAAFARTGNPNGAGLPEWPQYNPETRAVLMVDDNPRVVEDPDGEVLRSAYGMK